MAVFGLDGYKAVIGREEAGHVTKGISLEHVHTSCLRFADVWQLVGCYCVAGARKSCLLLYIAVLCSGTSTC